MENEVMEVVISAETVVDDAKSLFANMDIDEINETLKSIRTAATEAKKAIRKAEKEAEKAEKKKAQAEKEAKNIEILKGLKEGDSIIIEIGSGKLAEEVEVSFVKMTEKRFTVFLDGKKRSTMFSKLVKVVSESDDVDAEADNSETAVA